MELHYSLHLNGYALPKGRSITEQNPITVQDHRPTKHKCFQKRSTKVPEPQEMTEEWPRISDLLLLRVAGPFAKFEKRWILSP